MEQNFYMPNDDSFTFIDLLQDEHLFILKKSPKIIVEIGCGSGVISKYLKDRYPDSLIISTDINQDALKYTNRNTKTEVIRSSLLSNLKQEFIDLLIFNPPYVETLDSETKFCDIRASFSGGEKGRKIIFDFISQLDKLKHFYLLVIKINDPVKIVNMIKEKNYDAEIVKERKIQGETIFIIRCNKILM